MSTAYHSEAESSERGGRGSYDVDYPCRGMLMTNMGLAIHSLSIPDNLRALCRWALETEALTKSAMNSNTYYMKELNIKEMTSLRGGQMSAFDISRSFNRSNVAAIVSASNVAEAVPTNVSSHGTVTQAAVAEAGNQEVQLIQ